MNRKHHDDELQKAQQAVERGEHTRDAVKDLINEQADHGADPDLARKLLGTVEGTLSKQRQIRDRIKSDAES
jgi:hypothetical protein